MIKSLTTTTLQKRQRRRAFTLIEAIIVITVLGILAAVIVPRIANITTASEDAVAEATAGRINALIEQIYAANGSVAATDLPSLITELTGGVTASGINFQLSDAPTASIQSQLTFSAGPPPSVATQ